jgi:hypothetical protein
LATDGHIMEPSGCAVPSDCQAGVPRRLPAPSISAHSDRPWQVDAAQVLVVAVTHERTMAAVASTSRD